MMYSDSVWKEIRNIATVSWN